jgi:hypothetical protein
MSTLSDKFKLGTTVVNDKAIGEAAVGTKWEIVNVDRSTIVDDSYLPVALIACKTLYEPKQQGFYVTSNNLHNAARTFNTFFGGNL